MPGLAGRAQLQLNGPRWLELELLVCGGAPVCGQEHQGLQVGQPYTLMK